MLDAGTLPRSADHGDRVDADAATAADLVAPDPGEAPHPRHLSESDRLEGMTVGGAGTRLDLDEDRLAALFGYDVDLTGATTPVATDDAVPLADQVVGRQSLTPPAELVLAGHGHLRPPVWRRSNDTWGESRMLVRGQIRPGAGEDSYSSSASSLGSSNSFAASSSTLTSLNVSTRTALTNRSER